MRPYMIADEKSVRNGLSRNLTVKTAIRRSTTTNAERVDTPAVDNMAMGCYIHSCRTDGSGPDILISIMSPVLNLKNDRQPAGS